VALASKTPVLIGLAFWHDLCFINKQMMQGPEKGCFVILSEAMDLTFLKTRFFATLRMTKLGKRPFCNTLLSSQGKNHDHRISDWKLQGLWQPPNSPYPAHHPYLWAEFVGEEFDFSVVVDVEADHRIPGKI
jgi:hypothetical protein